MRDSEDILNAVQNNIFLGPNNSINVNLYDLGRNPIQTDLSRIIVTSNLLSLNLPGIHIPHG